MNSALVLSISAAIAAFAIPIVRRKHPYSPSAARLACGLWVIAFVGLNYWLWTTLEESALKTIALVFVGMLAFGALLHTFKARPFAPEGD